jgi:hypothetical protein
MKLLLALIFPRPTVEGLVGATLIALGIMIGAAVMSGGFGMVGDESGFTDRQH